MKKNWKKRLAQYYNIRLYIMFLIRYRNLFVHFRKKKISEKVSNEENEPIPTETQNCNSCNIFNIFKTSGN